MVIHAVWFQIGIPFLSASFGDNFSSFVPLNWGWAPHITRNPMGRHRFSIGHLSSISELLFTPSLLSGVNSCLLQSGPTTPQFIQLPVSLLTRWFMENLLHLFLTIFSGHLLLKLLILYLLLAKSCSSHRRRNLPRHNLSWKTMPIVIVEMCLIMWVIMSMLNSDPTDKFQLLDHLTINSPNVFMDLIEFLIGLGLWLTA